MNRLQTLSAATALMLTMAMPWSAWAEDTNSEHATAPITPGTVTAPHDAAAGKVSSESADAMHPNAHEAASGKAKKVPPYKKHKVPLPGSPVPLAGADSKPQ